jgi:hypothetical protein
VGEISSGQTVGLAYSWCTLSSSVIRSEIAVQLVGHFSTAGFPWGVPVKRAAILIGVHKTGGGLPPLRAVGDCVTAMEQWAKNQGIAPKSIVSVTDLANKKVTINSILDVVRDFGDAGVEQLIVYFAGHGFSGSMGDYWLLSDAPEDGNAAVNVYGSEFNARKGVFSHIVFISDACRVATKNIRDNAVRGGVVFPNLQIPGPSKNTDQFFATLLGDPAFEVNVDGVYKSIYTATLVDALNGMYKALLEIDVSEGATVLRPNPLKSFLPEEVGRRLRLAGATLPEDVRPDAYLNSNPSCWIAAFSPPLQPSSGTDNPLIPSFGKPPSVDIESKAVGGFSLATDHFTQSVDDILVHHNSPLVAFRNTGRTPTGSLSSHPGQTFRTNCGLVVAGAYIRTVKDYLDSAFQVGDSSVQVNVRKFPTSVLIELTSGNGVWVPAFPGYVGHLRFGGRGLLESLFYEPAQGSPGWERFSEKAARIRALRAEFNRVAQSKTPRLAELTTSRMSGLESVMRYESGIDLTLAILMAYAYLNAHCEDALQRVWARTVLALRISPLDIKMLLPNQSKMPGNPAGTMRLFVDKPGTMPPFPLYAQGWALMAALDRPLPPTLEKLQSHVEPAPWTTLDREGVTMISEYIKQIHAPSRASSEKVDSPAALLLRSDILTAAEQDFLNAEAYPDVEEERGA